MYNYIIYYLVIMSLKKKELNIFLKIRKQMKKNKKIKINNYKMIYKLYLINKNNYLKNKKQNFKKNKKKNINKKKIKIIYIIIKI